MSQSVDRKATHGWGSTPSQRHFVSHEQALKILDAGVKRAKEIKYVFPALICALRERRNRVEDN